jgi:thiosulfate/3-mercaptopyruvate sulfurtransferase
MISTDGIIPAPPGARSARQTLSTAELRHRLGDPGLVVVDVRPLAAYNGWRLQGEARGGHIRGAVAFPLTWLDQVQAGELGALLASKGIRREKTIVVYGYDAQDSARLLGKLEELGYEAVLAYDAGLAEWAAVDDLPLDRLPNYEKLVYPDWLHRLLNGEPVEAHPANGFALFHVNFGVPEEYADGHLPGAMYLGSNALESPADWNRRLPEELEAALRAHGITRDKTILLYGRDTVGDPNEKWPGRRAGQIAAARAALILMYAGVEDVRLLDGGYDAWVIAGYPLETVERKPTPVAAFGAEIPRRPDFIVDLDEAKAILADPQAELVSIRTWAEHVGNVSGYNYIGPRGRIPGSVWGNCGTDAYHMQHYRNVDNTMRDYHEIAANWREAGITPDKRIAFHCGTGWRASETFFYAYLMGWQHVAVYDGGWFEWSRDPSNPVEIGAP